MALRILTSTSIICLFAFGCAGTNTPKGVGEVGPAVVADRACEPDRERIPPPSLRPVRTRFGFVVSPPEGGTHRLARRFEEMGLDLDRVRNAASPVPRVFLISLPPDLAAVPSIETRKAVFIAAILPMILRVNEDILRHRAMLVQMRRCLNEVGHLSPAAWAWLEDMARHYEADADPDALLHRVDIVPPSLTIAQAAIESGWGTSSFAQAGNALFGQYVDKEYGGTKPRDLPADTQVRVATFECMIDSVASYVRNINSHRQYREFRRSRAEMRARGRAVDGLALAGTLMGYSERRHAYVRDLKSIIDTNDLQELDGARLAVPAGSASAVSAGGGGSGV